MVATVGKGWSLARSLVALFDEADRRWPDRSRASDGSIGDRAHAARVSDHNPDSTGDVLAGDLTDDKANGCDADLFAEHLRKSRDPRVKYVICNGRIFKSTGTMAWQWRPYDGVNAHEKHTHVSILDTAAAKNDTSPWFPYADAPVPEGDDMGLTDLEHQLLDQIAKAVVPLHEIQDTRYQVRTIITEQLNALVVPYLAALTAAVANAGAVNPADVEELAGKVADELAERLKD